MPEGRMIEVEDARIRTATVEIRSLTVSGRQVTQTVFKQLLVEPIIDPDTANLMGVPGER